MALGSPPAQLGTVAWGEAGWPEGAGTPPAPWAPGITGSMGANWPGMPPDMAPAMAIGIAAGIIPGIMPPGAATAAIHIYAQAQPRVL